MALGAQVLKILEVFTAKHDRRKKCRLVVRGDLERGNKSKENYSPTADRVLLTCTVERQT